MVDPRIVSKAEWGASNKETHDIIKPRGITLHWAGTHMGVYRPGQYPGVVRGIERFHEVTRGWKDIAYNWLVDPHGGIYEGRGEFKRSAANGTNTGNSAHEAICYLGGEGDPVTDLAIDATANLIFWRRRRGVGDELVPHSHWKATQCPGDVWRGILSGNFVETPPTVSAKYRWSVRPTMRRGSKGLHVAEWQIRLRAVTGKDLGQRGEFGPYTEEITKEFQSGVPHLVVDGIAGPLTQNAMQWIGVAGGKFE